MRAWQTRRKTNCFQIIQNRFSLKGHCHGILASFYNTEIGHCRNVRGLGKSMVVFRLFEKLRYSNERSAKFESLYHG